MKVLARLESFAGLLGRIWTNHWLLIVGSFFVVGSAVLKWVEFPFSRNLKGLQLPLFHDVSLMPHLTLFSFGFAAVAILLGGLLFVRFSPGFLAASAAVLLTLFALAPVHIAFQQPAMLQRLVNEDEAMPLLKAFTKSYLPQNYGAAEAIPKRLILYSGWGRFMAGCAFLRLGWYCLGFGSLLVAFYVLRRLRGERGMVGLAIFALPLAALAIVIAPAMLGQHFFTKGSIAKAEGRNRDAITAYRRAMRWDSWHTQDIALYAVIGELQRAAGIAEDSPERHVRRAVDLEKASQYEQAIFEFEAAAKAGGALGRAARREAAYARVTLGLALYKVGGIGSAVTNWQQAIAEDPSLIYGLPYLARGYFDIGSYEAAVQTANQVIKIVKDHNSLLGDAYSLGADSYARLGLISEARDYYRLSLAADPVENYWALTGLVGE